MKTAGVVIIPGDIDAVLEAIDQCEDPTFGAIQEKTGFNVIRLRQTLASMDGRGLICIRPGKNNRNRYFRR